jgi:hypothetical protein
MDSTAAAHLATHLSSEHTQLCESVATRLLNAFPELVQTLRIEENYTPIARLTEVSVERLYELVRAALLFEQPALVDNDLRWAHGVLPRSGVTYEHQSTMIRWFFEEVTRLPLSVNEHRVATELERHMLSQVRYVYHGNTN